MKTLLIFLFFCTSVSAQQKGDKVILVKNVSFDHVVNTLLDNGYFIERKDDTYKTLRTDKFNVSGFKMVLNLRVKDSTCFITSKAVDMVIVGEVDIENIGTKASVYKTCFNKMNEIAKLIGNEIEYRKN